MSPPALHRTILPRQATNLADNSLEIPCMRMHWPFHLHTRMECTTNASRQGLPRVSASMSYFTKMAGVLIHFVNKDSPQQHEISKRRLPRDKPKHALEYLAAVVNFEEHRSYFLALMRTRKHMKRAHAHEVLHCRCCCRDPGRVIDTLPQALAHPALPCRLSEASLN